MTLNYAFDMPVLEEAKVVRVSKASVQNIHDDIFYVRFDSDSLIELQDVMEVQQLLDKALERRPMKILLEFAEYTSATAEARTKAAEIVVDLVAEAMVFKSLAQRLLVHAYILRLKKTQKHPVKSFTSRAKAIEWLKSKG